MKRIHFWMLGCAVLMASRPALADDVIDQMRNFLTAGQSVEAYRLGQDNQQRLGEADFDLLFGLAALDGGRASEGVLALERYRMAHPGDDKAWLSLARGYVMLGENDRARAELEDFLAANPDEALAAVAREYLDVVRIREEDRLRSSRAWLEAGLGFDSNVNGGPNASLVNLPIFGQISLNDGLTETPDSMNSLAGGFAHHRLLRPGLTAFFDANASFRGYLDEFDYNQSSLGAKGGVLVNREGKLWRTTVSHQSTWLDSSRYLSSTGLGEEWINPFAINRTVSAHVQYARLDYGAKGGTVGTRTTREADFWGIGLGWRQSFTAQWKPRLNLSLAVADERNNQGREDLSRTLLNAGALLNLTTAPQWGLHLGYAFQQSHYGDEDPILLLTRDDDSHTLNTGLTYLISLQWSVHGDVSYTTNQSNIDLNDYKRTLAMLKVRYDFR